MHDDWQSKVLLVASNLSVKYAIIYKIGVENWMSSSHGLGITPSLDSLLYEIGSRANFYFNDYLFEQVVKQDESYKDKLPIAKKMFTIYLSLVLMKTKDYQIRKMLKSKLILISRLQKPLDIDLKEIHHNAKVFHYNSYYEYP